MSKLIKHKIYQRAILLLVFGVIIVAAGCVRRQQGDKEVEIGEPVTQPTLMKLYNEAQELIRARETTEAIAKYRVFLEKHPQGAHVPQIYLWIGMAYIWKGEPKQALAQYEKIITEYPDFAHMPWVLYEMHIAYTVAQENKNANAKLQQLIDAYPDTRLAAQARFIRGQNYYEQGAYQSTIEACKQVMTDIADPEMDLLWRGRALYMIGQSYRKLEQYDQAIQSLQQSIDATQARQQSYEQQGINTENFDAAKAQIQRILGDTYRDAERYDEAVASYQEILNAYPNDYHTPLALYSMAQTLGTQGKTQQAIAAYQQLIARDPNYTEKAQKEINLLNQAPDETRSVCAHP